MIQRLRRRYEGQPEPETEVPDISPEAMPGLQKPVTQSTPRMSESEKYFRAMQETMNNRPARGAYLAAMADAPDPSQYQPSKWRRLAAAVAGGAMGATGQAGQGIEAAETINRAPYAGAMEQWQSRLKPAQAAAQVEEEDVQSRLGMLTSARDFGLDYNKYLASTAHQQRQDAIAKDRVRVAEIVAKNPDYHYITVPGGVKATDSKGYGEDYFIPGQTVEGMNAETAQFNANTQRGMLGVARTNAATAQKNATTSERQYQSQAGLRNEQITNMRELRRVGSEQLALRQGDAYVRGMDAALSEMEGDPDFGDFIEYDPNTGVYKVSDTATDEEYDTVMEEAEDRMQRTRQPTREPRRNRSITNPKTPRSYITPGVD